jgi:riboflavin kinase/FMN adenylyltransferase
MQIVRLGSLQPLGWPHPAVTVGNFDGVHRGHQALVATAVADAREMGGTAVALTFDPHPSQVLSPDRAPSALMTLDQKAEVLASLGIDRVAVLPFTIELSHQSPEEFAQRLLHETLGARTVVVGSGFRFGHRRAGDLATLEALGRRLGFQVHGLAPLLHEGAPISSSRIREAVARGDVEAAEALLGRPFFLDGTVARGEARGRRLGFPTANLAVVGETLPARGVYVGRCQQRGPVTGGPWGAVVNVGRRPTFGGTTITVEAHLLDFDGDLYDAFVRLSFTARLRDELAFPGPEALVAQIRQDVAAARRVLEKP